ncbi:MAG: AI-2E family transporter [Candidatus Omnitrophica bacterium]|nr:AI-2E family transporter [Candidatus Omnitrophota bacterium]
MTREQLISLFFIALLLFVVVEVIQIFSPFFTAIFWGAIIAFAFYPLYQNLKRPLKKRETLAAALMTILIFLVVVPPVVFLLINLAGQAIELYNLVSSYVREGGLERLIEQVRSFAWIQSIEAKLFQWEPVKLQMTEWLLNLARTVGNFGAGQIGDLTKNFFFIVLNVFLTYVLVFVFLLDGEKIYSFFYGLAPLETKNKKYIFGQINETFSAVIRGQLLTSLAQAMIAGIVFWALGLPVPIFFAAVTFLAGMIPVVGASFIWFPFVIYLIALGQYEKAMVLFVLGVLGISLIDNILKPALIGEKTKLPYFLLFFGVMGGIKIFGLMGIFLAPAVLSLFFALVKIFQEKYLPSEN